jgi:hypothetical protein
MRKQLEVIDIILRGAGCRDQGRKTGKNPLKL